MSSDTRRYILDVSEYFFRLTTESLRIRSNETLEYQSLEKLVNERAVSAPQRMDHQADTLRAHLAAVPTKGKKRICIQIKQSSAESLEDAKALLSSKLETDATIGDTLSVLLFDYIVEQKAALALEKIRELSERNHTAEGGSYARKTKH